MSEQPFVKRPHRGWMAAEAPNGIHVVPVEDLVMHMVEDCQCGPRMQLVVRDEDDDSPDVWMHVHHSLDGRERYEAEPGTLGRTHVTEEEPNG